MHQTVQNLIQIKEEIKEQILKNSPDKNEEFFQRKNHKGQYKRWFHLLDEVGGRILLDSLDEIELSTLVEHLSLKAQN